MIVLLLIAAVVVAFVVFYVLEGRTWMKAKLPRLFAWIEPAERWLWNKSETILWSRFLILLGGLPFLLDQLQLFNIPQFLALIPPKYQGYLTLAFVACGVISEILRRFTTKPLAIVEMSDRDVPPDVQQAVATAEVAKDDAVAKVNAAKATGTM